mgnify:CR=1 FL=1
MLRHVQAGGVKAHFDGVLSGRNIHCAQDIVGACQFGRLSVDGYVPAVRIIDFGDTAIPSWALFVSYVRRLGA